MNKKYFGTDGIRGTVNVGNINGEKFFTPETINLLDVITYFNYSSSLLVIEYNNFICRVSAS